MNKTIKYLSFIFLLYLPTSLLAWQWLDLWQTADQQGAKLLQSGKAQQASKVFKNPDWQAVSLYRAEDYARAFQQFNAQRTSDGQYNAGNAAAYLGRYQEAIAAYDKAIALNPRNTDAITNREIIKKLMNKKNQQKNNSCNSKQPGTSNKKNEKNNAENKSNNKSSEQQDQKQNNSYPQNTNDKTKTTQNNPQKNVEQNTNSQKEINNSSSNPAQSLEENKELNQKQEKIPLIYSGQTQAQENQKQLLRRLSDDPGGLLRRKFLRDYVRRHGISEGGN